MVRSWLSRISPGGLSALLLCALLLMIGGLVASDRALTQAAMMQTRVDAEQTALAVRQVLEAPVRAGVPLVDIARDSTLRALVAQEPAGRVAAAIVADRETVLVAGTRSAFHGQLTQTVPLLLPSGASWNFVVAHSRGVDTLRIALWILSLTTVAFLGFGIIRERRQAIRVTERSAELERLYSEVARANTAKSEFLANISHELRTPLNAIVGFVELLREGVYGELSPRQIPPVDRIAASATHLRHLVDQVLDIAKIAAGRLEVHPEVIALRPFVLNVVSELESLIAERNLTLSIAVGVSLPRVRTDPGHLRPIVVTLIGNGVKYTRAGGVAVRRRLVTASRAGERRIPAEDAALA